MIPSALAINAEVIDLSTKKILQSLLESAAPAAAGSTQATATPLASAKNFVTAADGTKGVRLPTAEVNMAVTVVNTDASSDLIVYPDTGASINGGSANATFTLAAGEEATFYATTTLAWTVAPAAAPSGDAAANSRTLTTTASLTAADHNALIFLNAATGFATTLPAPIAGFKCTVINKTANTSGNHTIVSASSANVIKGNQNSVAGDAGDSGTADDTINFVANQSVAGDRVELYSDGTSWFAYATSRVAAGITFTQAS